jgi:hypothetical protein
MNNGMQIKYFVVTTVEINHNLIPISCGDLCLPMGLPRPPCPSRQAGY